MNGPILIYLLKVIIFSAVFYGYYLLALRDKNFHQYNRYYLLSAIVLSTLMPLLKLDLMQADEEPGALEKMVMYRETFISFSGSSSAAPVNYWPLAMSIVFGLGALAVAFTNLRALVKIRQLKKRYTAEEYQDISLYRTDDPATPFSFFNDLFWNNKIAMHSNEGRDILQHELAHISEKHSYDKLFVNAVLLFYWWNPLFWVIRKELGLIHEFCADKKSVTAGDTNAFSRMILAGIPIAGNHLTNPFFLSPIKRRLTMIKNNKTKSGYFSRVIALPLAMCLIFLFAVRVTKTFAQKPPAEVSAIVPSLSLKDSTVFENATMIFEAEEFADSTRFFADGKEIKIEALEGKTIKTSRTVFYVKNSAAAIAKFGKELALFDIIDMRGVKIEMEQTRNTDSGKKISGNHLLTPASIIRRDVAGRKTESKLGEGRYSIVGGEFGIDPPKGNPLDYVLLIDGKQANIKDYKSKLIKARKFIINGESSELFKKYGKSVLEVRGLIKVEPSASGNTVFESDRAALTVISANAEKPLPVDSPNVMKPGLKNFISSVENVRITVTGNVNYENTYSPVNGVIYPKAAGQIDLSNLTRAEADEKIRNAFKAFLPANVDITITYEMTPGTAGAN